MECEWLNTLFVCRRESKQRFAEHSTPASFRGRRQRPSLLSWKTANCANGKTWQSSGGKDGVAIVRPPARSLAGTTTTSKSTATTAGSIDVRRLFRGYEFVKKKEPGCFSVLAPILTCSLVRSIARLATVFARFVASLVSEKLLWSLKYNVPQESLRTNHDPDTEQSRGLKDRSIAPEINAVPTPIPRLLLLQGLRHIRLSPF